MKHTFDEPPVGIDQPQLKPFSDKFAAADASAVELDENRSKLLSISVMKLFQICRQRLYSLWSVGARKTACPDYPNNLAAANHWWQGAGLFIACVVAPLAVIVAGQAAEREKPYFLVATPDMPDPIFQQTVVLMLPSAQTPLIAGVIINKPTAIPIRKVFPHASLPQTPKNETVYFGGPVGINEASLILRSSKPPPHSSRLFDDIFVSTEPDAISALLRHRSNAIDARLFLGRAQWAHAQLRAEVAQGSWYVAPATAKMVFSDPGQVWRTLVLHAQLHEVRATFPPRRSAISPSALFWACLYPRDGAPIEVQR